MNLKNSPVENLCGQDPNKTCYQEVKAGFGPYVHNLDVSRQHIPCKHLAKDSDYFFNCPCIQQRTSAVHPYSASLFSDTHPPWSGCTNEDIAERYEQAEQRSQRKVNEAAEVTLSSTLLIAVFEERVETWTCDRTGSRLVCFSKGTPLMTGVCVSVCWCHYQMLLFVNEGHRKAVLEVVGKSDFNS